MKFFIRQKGSISIMLLLLMVPVFTFAGLIIDAARISSAKTQILCAGELASNAALSEYDTYLEEAYGLFALTEDESVLLKNLTDCFVKTIESKGDNDNIVDMKSNNVKISFDDGEVIANTTVFENQINDYMQYRTPINLTKGILVKASSFFGLDKNKKIIELKTKYDEKLSFINDDVKTLYKKLKNNEDVTKTVDLIDEIVNEMSSVEGAKYNLVNAVDSLQNETIKNVFLNDLSYSELFSIDNLISLKDKLLIGEDLSGDKIVNYLESEFSETGEQEEPILDDLNEFNEKETQESEVKYFNISDYISESLETELETLNHSSGSPFSIDEFLKNFSGNLKSGVNIEEYINLFFDCKTDESKMPEIEYIIFGKDSLESNIDSAKLSIFSIRLVLNSIFAFTNANMKTAAMTSAIAIAGWTGFGATAVCNIILAALATAETTVDVNALMNGESVPIYKTESTWTLGINGLSQMLEKEVKEIVVLKVDDVFEKISEIPIEQIENAQNHINDYVDKMSENVVNAASSYVINVVDRMISKNLTEEQMKSTISDEIKNISLSEESILGFAEIAAFKLLLNSNYEEFTHEKLGGLGDKVTLVIKEKINEYAEALKIKTKEIINEGGASVKRKLTAELDSYISKLSSYISSDTGETQIRGSLAGGALTMNYREYLRLIILVELSSKNQKTNILERALKIIQINAQKENPDFCILNAYTKINTEVSVGVHTNFYNAFAKANAKRVPVSSKFEYGF